MQLVLFMASWCRHVTKKMFGRMNLRTTGWVGLQTSQVSVLQTLNVFRRRVHDWDLFILLGLFARVILVVCYHVHNTLPAHSFPVVLSWVWSPKCWEKNVKFVLQHRPKVFFVRSLSSQNYVRTFSLLMWSKGDPRVILDILMTHPRLLRELWTKAEGLIGSGSEVLWTQAPSKLVVTF